MDDEYNDNRSHIGLDVNDLYCSVACIDSLTYQPEVLRLFEGEGTMVPVCIAFNSDNHIFIGSDAQNLPEDPKITKISDFIEKLGYRNADLIKAQQKPVQISAQQMMAQYKINFKGQQILLSAIEVTAIYFKIMFEKAQGYQNRRKFKRLVLTISPHTSTLKRKDLMASLELAGYGIDRILSSNLALCLSHIEQWPAMRNYVCVSLTITDKAVDGGVINIEDLILESLTFEQRLIKVDSEEVIKEYLSSMVKGSMDHLALGQIRSNLESDKQVTIELKPKPMILSEAKLKELVVAKRDRLECLPELLQSLRKQMPHHIDFRASNKIIVSGPLLSQAYLEDSIRAAFDQQEIIFDYDSSFGCVGAAWFSLVVNPSTNLAGRPQFLNEILCLDIFPFVVKAIYDEKPWSDFNESISAQSTIPFKKDIKEISANNRSITLVQVNPCTAEEIIVGKYFLEEGVLQKKVSVQVNANGICSLEENGQSLQVSKSSCLKELSLHFSGDEIESIKLRLKTVFFD